MQIRAKYWIVASIGLAVLLAGWWMYRAEGVTPPVSLTDASSSVPNSASSTENPIPREQIQSDRSTQSFTINPSDTVTSWNFKGAYAGNETLIKNANTEIARLSSLLGTKEYPDYLIYTSIANQYDLLGDGANEFSYLKKALLIDSTETGLAWHNVGQLFTRLGAYATARTAFERAVSVQPLVQYRQVLIEFLKAHYPEDATAISQQERTMVNTPSESNQ